MPPSSVGLHSPQQGEEKEKKADGEFSSSLSFKGLSGICTDPHSRVVSGVHTPQSSYHHHPRDEDHRDRLSSGTEEVEAFGSSSFKTDGGVTKERSGPAECREGERKEEEEEDAENLSWNEAVDMLFGSSPRKIWRLLNYCIFFLLALSLAFLCLSSNQRDQDVFLLFAGFIGLLLVFALVLNW